MVIKNCCMISLFRLMFHSLLKLAYIVRIYNTCLPVLNGIRCHSVQVVIPWNSPLSLRALLCVQPFTPDLELSQVNGTLCPRRYVMLMARALHPDLEPAQVNGTLCSRRYVAPAGSGWAAQADRPPIRHSRSGGLCRARTNVSVCKVEA